MAKISASIVVTYISAVTVLIFSNSNGSWLTFEGKKHDRRGKKNEDEGAMEERSDMGVPGRGKLSPVPL